MRGIKNIDDYCVVLESRLHLRGVHGRGYAGLKGKWNDRWKWWLHTNKTAGAEEVLEQMYRMMEEFGLGGADDVIKYK